MNPAGTAELKQRLAMISGGRWTNSAVALSPHSLQQSQSRQSFDERDEGITYSYSVVT